MAHICIMKLNLPTYEFKIKTEEGKTWVFDEIRKKQLVLTPEEWVRQHLVKFLIHEKGCPKGLISLEEGLQYNQLSKRADIVVRDRNGNIFMVVEVKAPTVKLDNKVLSQIAAYHKSLGAQYLLISNGMAHFCLDMRDEGCNFIDDVPSFE